MSRISRISAWSILSIAALALGACNDSKSYAELLTEENQAINAYLLNQTVELSLPENNNFITGEDAPFYKLDEEGSVYMRVIDAGNPEWKAQPDEQIYFRFMRWSLLNYDPYTQEHIEGWGNSDDLTLGSASFRFGNYTLSSSASWGSGLQLPLNYIGLESEVYLIIKSQYGLTSEISNVTPFLYHVRYFKRGSTGADDDEDASF